MFEGVCTAAIVNVSKLVRVPAPGPHYTLAPSGVLASPNPSHVRGKHSSLAEKDTSLRFRYCRQKLLIIVTNVVSLKISIQRPRCFVTAI